MNEFIIDHAPAGGLTEYGHHYLPGQFLPFYVPRCDMPQIDQADYLRLIDDVREDLGSSVEFDVARVSNLHAHQRIDHNRAMHMKPDVKLKPVLVSSDGYVVDGNHRWWAHVHDGDEYINVIRINERFGTIVLWALGRPYVYRITPDTPIRN